MRLKRFRRRLPGCLLALLCLQAGFGQQPDTILPAPAPLDTTPVRWITGAAPDARQPLDDSLPGYDFRMYDPARRTPWADWGNLGITGSPARPLLYAPQARIGFWSGYDAFRLYRLHAEHLRHFKHSRTFSEVFFNQGASQNDNAVKAVLSRTFAGGTTASVDYQTFLSVGQYRYQTVRNSAFSIGLHVPFQERYQGFATFTANGNRQQENGGLTEDADFGDGSLSGPINAPIRLPSQRAESRYADRQYRYQHHYRFATSQKGRQFRASHTAQLTNEVMKFAHPNPGADTAFYGAFLVDPRGVRQYTTVRRLDNHLEIGSIRLRDTIAAAENLAAGIQYNRIQVRSEPGDTTIHNTFLTGKLQLSSPGKASIEAAASLGLFGNLGEYNVQADALWPLTPMLNLKGGIISQRYQASWIAHRLYVSGRPYWLNNFENPIETSLRATLDLQTKVPLTIMAQSHLINQYLYFNAQGLPEQTSSPVQIAQFGASTHLQWKNLHLTPTISLQQTNRKDVIRLPEWFARASLYYNNAIFNKRMLLQAGVDMRVNSSFQPDAWQPLTAQFILNDNLVQEPYLWIDLFASFKIETFRFFFRYENLSAALWNTEDTFRQTAWHPQLFNTFRLGIGWRFLDK